MIHKIVKTNRQLRNDKMNSKVLSLSKLIKNAEEKPSVKKVKKPSIEVSKKADNTDKTKEKNNVAE